MTRLDVILRLHRTLGRRISSSLLLAGITFEDDEGTMTVAAARSAVDHVSHTIQSPGRVWIERTEAGARRFCD